MISDNEDSGPYEYMRKARRRKEDNTKRYGVFVYIPPHKSYYYRSQLEELNGSNFSH